MPVKLLLIMASSDDSTRAANRAMSGKWIGPGSEGGCTGIVELF
jgi:hypothetical protein